MPTPQQWDQALSLHLQQKPDSRNFGSVQEFEAAFQKWAAMLDQGMQRAEKAGLRMEIPPNCSLDSEWGLLRVTRKGD